MNFTITPLTEVSTSDWPSRLLLLITLWYSCSDNFQSASLSISLNPCYCQLADDVTMCASGMLFHLLYFYTLKILQLCIDVLDFRNCICMNSGSFRRPDCTKTIFFSDSHPQITHCTQYCVVIINKPYSVYSYALSIK